MGGGPCVVIIEGAGLIGEAQKFISTAEASCNLIGYLANDPDAHFKDSDAKLISDFHLKAQKQIRKLNDELDKLNRDLAAKYDRNID